MRRGIILSYDNKLGYGVIQDSNNQNIQFHNKDLEVTFNTSDIVGFSIAFVGNSLAAINVIHTWGRPVNKLNAKL